MDVTIESLGLLQSQEIMKELGDRDLIKAFADPAVAVNRRVVRRLKSSTRYQDKTGALRRGWSARRTPARYNTVRGDSDATRLSTIFSRPAWSSKYWRGAPKNGAPAQVGARVG